MIGQVVASSSTQELRPVSLQLQLLNKSKSNVFLQMNPVYLKLYPPIRALNWQMDKVLELDQKYYIQLQQEYLNDKPLN